MALTLDQMKAAFKTPENEGGNLPNNYYPFWKMKDGESATVRFLPDANTENALGFMVEKLMHTLEINGERKSVPCLKMYDEDCPICKVSSEYYNKDDKTNGKKYWRKKQYITQAQIVSDPLDADETTGENHEGKVRFLTLGFQIYTVIKEAFESNELDEIPFAYKGGCDFVIKKSKQGEYSTYAVGSHFSRKTRDLEDEEVATIEENLSDLSSLLPKHPTLEKVNGMLEAALTGGSYDGGNSGGAPAGSSAPATGSTPPPAPAEEVTDGDADDILDAIRARRNKASEE